MNRLIERLVMGTALETESFCTLKSQSMHLSVSSDAPANLVEPIKCDAFRIKLAISELDNVQIILADKACEPWYLSHESFPWLATQPADAIIRRTSDSQVTVADLV